MIQRQEKMSLEIMDELKNTTSPRVEILLATNFVEMILKDFMYFLLKTETARDIPRDLIVDILVDRKILSMDFAKDVRAIFKIRDAYAHRLSFNEANQFVEKEILPKLYFLKQEIPKVADWEQRPLPKKIYDCSTWIFVHLRDNFHNMVLD